MYLLCEDINPENRSLFPVIGELKRTSLWKTLTHQEWQEDIEMTLMDDQEFLYKCQIKYHFLGHFYMTCRAENDSPSQIIKLNKKRTETGKKYYIKNNMILSIGKNKFKIIIKRKLPRHLLSSSPTLSPWM